MTIMVATTTCAPYMDRQARWSSWMRNAYDLRASVDEDVIYFAALELDGRGLEPFEPFIEALDKLEGTNWTFTLNDGRTEVTTSNRLRHIVMGQNLCLERAGEDPSISHILFLAADTAPPSDILPKLLEMDHALVAPYIGTYGLRGPKVDKYTYPVEDAVGSAAALLIRRDHFRRVKFRWDPDLGGMSDDFCYQLDSLDLGVPTYVRHDCLAEHFPKAIGAIETRIQNREVVQ